MTVEFIASNTCIKDKDKNIVSGDPEKLKKFMIHGFFLGTQPHQIQIGNW